MTRIISLHYADVSSCAQAKKERVVSLDLAKGFTVLFIPAIHTVMLYSSPDVHASWLGPVLGFIAEWPGAQLLMFVMGMSFSFSRKSTRKQLTRAVIIFVAGYVLNVFKFLFLYWLHWLPASFLHDLNFSHSLSPGAGLFLVGDILQFAGIALLVMSILKLSKYYSVWAVFIAYLVIVGSPLVWDWHHHNLFTDHLLHLAGGNVPDCFFPVIPWIVYPLAGLAIGNYLQWPFSSKRAIFFSGVFFLVSGYGMHFLPYHFPETLFWRTYPDKTIMHLGFVMVWMSMWFAPKGALRKFAIVTTLLKIIRRVLRFCGRNITLIYLVQWVVIFWMLPLFGYRHLDVGESVVATGLVYVVVFGMVFLFRRKRKSG